MDYTRDQIERHICVILEEQGVDLVLPIGPEMTLTSLGLDSLDLAELQVMVEDLYNIRFGEDTPIRPEVGLSVLIDEIFALV